MKRLEIRQMDRCCILRVDVVKVEVEIEVEVLGVPARPRVWRLLGHSELARAPRRDVQTGRLVRNKIGVRVEGSIGRFHQINKREGGQSRGHHI